MNLTNALTAAIIGMALVMVEWCSVCTWRRNAY